MNSNRRSFFRGTTLSAAGFLLQSFLRDVQAESAGSHRPIRFVFFLQGNGINPARIRPHELNESDRTERFTELDLRKLVLPPAIQALQPFIQQLTIINGLSGRVSLGRHGMGMGALGCFPADKGTYSQTIDSALSDRLKAIFPHVGLGIESAPSRSIVYNVSAKGPNAPLPTLCRPLEAYEYLFSVGVEKASREKTNADLKLLDFLAADVRRIRQRLNPNEREKLERYLEAFEGMSHKRSGLLSIAERVRLSAPEVNERYTDETFAFQRLQAQFEIAAGALISGMTNVVTISSGCGRDQNGVDFDGRELGLRKGPVSAHEIGHGQAVSGVPSEELHIRTHNGHCEQLAAFLRKLQSVPEGDGTMLDNTLIVFMSDSAEAHHPTAREWPVLLIGNAGRRLRTDGRWLRYPAYGRSGHRTMSSLFLALLRIVGDNRPRFGLPDTHLGNEDDGAPLEELLA